MEKTASWNVRNSVQVGSGFRGLRQVTVWALGLKWFRSYEVEGSSDSGF